MAKEILYTTAVDDEGVLVHVSDAEKGITYYCPSCKVEYSLKKSGNTGKGSKRPHFSHKPNESSSNCTAESVLHYSFKKNLIDLLNNYLQENKELIINWNCSACSEYNKGNLLAKTTTVREEYYLKDCQPDIALLDTDENVIAVIEIVVTHSPEEKVLEFYGDNEIILIQINLSSDEDLKNIERKTLTPSIVDYCLSHKCSNQKRYSIHRKILSHSDTCGRCYKPIERYTIEVNSAFGMQETLDFTDNEINIVKAERKNIDTKTNQTTNERYPISICHYCKVMSRRNRRF